MRRLPLGGELLQVASDLCAALRHQRIPRLQLGDFPGHGIEREAVRVEHLGELRVRGQDRGTEGADRTLPPEQCRRVEYAPRADRPDTGADLEVDMPVRITRTARLVRDGDRLQLLHRHDLLLASRPDPRDRVLAEPGANLRHGVALGRIQRLRYLGVQGGGDGEGLGDVHDHLREPGRSAPPLTGQAGLAHRLPGERVDPIDPLAVLVRRQRDLTDHPTLGIDGRELRQGGASLQVILVSPGAVGLQIAQRIRSGAPEQDHTALHDATPFLVSRCLYLPR